MLKLLVALAMLSFKLDVTRDTFNVYILCYSILKKRHIQSLLCLKINDHIGLVVLDFAHLSIIVQYL